MRTDGARGGSSGARDGSEGRYAAVPLPGPLVDAYGAGDVMMAALALGLGAGAPLEQALVSAAAAAAGQLTRRGAAPPARPGRA